MKNGEIPKSTGVISLLLRCNDFFNKSVQGLQGDLNLKIDPGQLLPELEAGLRGELPQATSSPDKEITSDPQAEQPTVEDPSVLMAAETERRLNEAPAASPPPATPKPTQAAAKSMPAAKSSPDESIRVSLNRLERLINIVGEMVIYQTVLREQVNTNNSNLLRRTVHQMGKVTKEVQDISMGLRMVSVKQTFQKMQRIVRDTATILGKKVHLHLLGEDTEIDKTVLEAIGDPLVHLIRNAVDHGIENSEKRRDSGKNEEGNVYLSAFHESGKLIIEIRDDGGARFPDWGPPDFQHWVGPNQEIVQ